ncbi:membrane protein [Thermobifida fusca]|nr:membrane protein [Thermobifida fusca]
MFRRRSASASQEQVMSNSTKSETDKAPARKGHSPKKGVPTPKRKEAARELRRPLSAPKTRREAYKLMWERERRRRQRERAGLVKPEDRYFRPQDLGPARALARDYVDSRRTLSEFFLYFSLAIIVLMFVPVPEVQLFAAYVVWPMMMVTIVIEGFFTARRVKKLIAEHYPKETENVRGSGMYAVMRQVQIRKLRLPKPRVNVGDDFLAKHRR